MRNFHRRKVKSRLQQTNLDGPSTSQSLRVTGQVHGQSNPNSGSSRLIGVENSEIHRLDGNALQNVTYSREECGAGNNSASLWLREPRLQVHHKERRELPMSNLWALPVDAHATELIYHCKPCLFHSIFIVKSLSNPVYPTNYTRPMLCKLITYHSQKTFRYSPRVLFL
jgi:hypothetical protein